MRDLVNCPYYFQNDTVSYCMSSCAAAFQLYGQVLMKPAAGSETPTACVSECPFGQVAYGETCALDMMIDMGIPIIVGVSVLVIIFFFVIAICCIAGKKGPTGGKGGINMRNVQ